MAKAVTSTLGNIISEQRGIPLAKAEDVVKGMRSANQYQVCGSSVFGCGVCGCVALVMVVGRLSTPPPPFSQTTFYKQILILSILGGRLVMRTAIQHRPPYRSYPTLYTPYSNPTSHLLWRLHFSHASIALACSYLPLACVSRLFPSRIVAELVRLLCVVLPGFLGAFVLILHEL